MYPECAKPKASLAPPGLVLPRSPLRRGKDCRAWTGQRRKSVAVREFERPAERSPGTSGVDEQSSGAVCKRSGRAAVLCARDTIVTG
jgi:hypothetical protein